MRVLLITGSYPPDKCGVGEYTYHLAEALAAQAGIEVGVLTGDFPGTTSDPSSVSVFRELPDWHMKRAFQVRRAIAAFKPDIVHIQYPARGYFGELPRYLPLLTWFLGVRVVQTWHEHFIGCSVLGWQNLLACDALIYVRPDLPERLPGKIRRLLGETPQFCMPSASTIPAVKLTEEEAQRIREEISGGKPIVCFFGFANANKGVEQLFEIADPTRHHLLLICDLSEDDAYQRKIIQSTRQAPWLGNVTITGFQAARRVGELLAVADAVVFPFPAGAGVWNSSILAAETAGAFTVTTSLDPGVLGYHAERNIFFAGCGQTGDMRDALHRYLGRRNEAAAGDEWGKIAMEHERIYRALLSE